MENQKFYLLKLKETLALKRKINPRYSLRAYARDLGIHPATLSQVLNGNRLLPMKEVSSVATKMNLSPQERILFKESLFDNSEASSFNQIVLKNDQQGMMKITLDKSLAVDPYKFAEAQAAITEFYQRMEAIYEGGSKTEVYQLTVQLKPLSC